MKNISLFIITKNEADKIRACIESARGIVDEIIVADSSSTDDTVKIAEELGAKVYQHPFKGFADQKNFALSKCTGKWALSLDADETLSKELANEITAIPDDTDIDGFYILRLNYFLGGRMNYSGLNKEYILRLARMGKSAYKDVLVHEILEVEGATDRLNEAMLHFSYSSLEDYFVKFNNYTSLAARDMMVKGRKFNIFIVILRFPIEFLKRYILKCGFMDGIRGFIWATISTFYVFVKYIKLWDLTRCKK